MIGRRGFLGGVVAATFMPVLAKTAPAQFTLPAPQTTEELAASMRRKAIMALGLNPEMIDSPFDSEFSLSRASLEFQARRDEFFRQQLIPQINDHMLKLWQACGVGATA